MNATTSPRIRLWPRSLVARLAVIALGFFAILIATYLVAVHYTSERLAAAWKLSDEFGLPKDVETLLGPAVPAEKNLAVPLDEAADIAAKLLVKESLKRGGVDYSKYQSEPEFQAAATALLNDSRYESLLKEADARTLYHSPILLTRPTGSTKQPYLEPRRDMIRVESRIARALVAQGKSEEAVRRLLRVARLTRRWENAEPIGMGAMINNAIRCLTIDALNDALRRGGPLSQSLHDEVEHETAANEAIIRSHLMVLQAHKLEAADLFDKVNPLTRVPFFHPFENNDRTKMLVFFDRLMKAAEKPGPAGNAETLDVERDLKRTKGHAVERFLYVGTTLLLPATMMIRDSYDRTLAYSRSLRVVNAWARRGELNADIRTLRLSADRFIDPYDGKPLRVAKSRAGPIIYSVGENLVDDGGNLVMLQDVGLGPTESNTETK